VEKKKSASHVASTNGSKSKGSVSCPKCKESHYLHKCKAFGSLPVSERKDFVIQNKLCFNCFFKDHSAKNCKMSFVCSDCGKKHHRLLHIPGESTSKVQVVSNTEDVSPPTSTTSSSVCSNQSRSSSLALLGTLMVTADDSSGQKQNCRVFLDDGSESHFISEQCMSFLGLKRRKTCVNVNGIGGKHSQTSYGYTHLRLYSKVMDFSIDIQALILGTVTEDMPKVKFDASWPHLQGLELSDPAFNQPGPIDILIGVKLGAYLKLPAIVYGPPGTPSAQSTKFGWMLSGEVANFSSHFRVHESRIM